MTRKPFLRWCFWSHHMRCPRVFFSGYIHPCCVLRRSESWSEMRWVDVIHRLFNVRRRAMGWDGSHLYLGTWQTRHLSEKVSNVYKKRIQSTLLDRGSFVLCCCTIDGGVCTSCSNLRRECKILVRYCNMSIYCAEKMIVPVCRVKRGSKSRKTTKTTPPSSLRII